MSASHETPASIPKGELFVYDDGAIDEVFTEGSFSMEALAERMDDPVAESGCAYVVTQQAVGGNAQVSRYYFDRTAIHGGREGITRSLVGAELGNPKYAVTIGSVWRTPVGDSQGVVTEVRLPWVHAGVGAQQIGPGQRSPLARGRAILDAF